MLKTAFENLRSRSPLIHNITNYVTVNDCANMVLACGASPIMADDAAEVEEITAICGGLNINIGTLNSRTVTSMLLAGKRPISWVTLWCWTRWVPALPICAPTPPSACCGRCSSQ